MVYGMNADGFGPAAPYTCITAKLLQVTARVTLRVKPQLAHDLTYRVPCVGSVTEAVQRETVLLNASVQVVVIVARDTPTVYPMQPLVKSHDWRQLSGSMLPSGSAVDPRQRT